MAEPGPWRPGDRVIARLPAGQATGYGRRHADVHGTVRAVDEPGLPPGVRVDLDDEVNGVRDCYATHGELRPEAGDG
jgi:hypothetical protein